MKSLYLRVWLTVVLTLALFALVSVWLAQRHVIQERDRLVQQGLGGERIRAMAELIAQALPESHEDQAQQAAALRQWSDRLRLPMALDDAQGRRIAASVSFDRRMGEGMGPAPLAVALDDGRTLWLMRGGRPAGERRVSVREPDGGQDRGPMVLPSSAPPAGGILPPAWASLDPMRSVSGLVAVLALLFLAVALGAYPVVRRLTRRLEALQRGVERFGAGSLGLRIDDQGRDEVAQVAAAFNRAAERIESLLQSNARLVANASHELRSPLARLKVSLSLMQDAQEGSMKERLRLEIEQNLRELDALVEELLLSSRLQAQSGDAPAAPMTDVDLLALLAEEAARAGASLGHVDGLAIAHGQERLLRRAVRNLLDNARRYGQSPVEAELRLVQWHGRQHAELHVLDRGPGVPADQAERVFEPFFRLPGHAESEGGVGLGLALVRQIAQHHGGQAEVRPRAGGGSSFILRLPLMGSPGETPAPKP